MTAVARVAIEDHPMLVADLLLSGPPLPDVTASLLTTDDLLSIFPSGSPRVPLDLCQKIAIVSDDLVVGWSGPYKIARDIISELRRLAAAQRFTYESLNGHLNNLDPSTWADFGLVGFIRDPDGRIAQCHLSNFSHTTQGSCFNRFGWILLRRAARVSPARDT